LNITVKYRRKKMTALKSMWQVIALSFVLIMFITPAFGINLVSPMNKHVSSSSWTYDKINRLPVNSDIDGIRVANSLHSVSAPSSSRWIKSNDVLPTSMVSNSLPSAKTVDRQIYALRDIGNKDRNVQFDSKLLSRVNNIETQTFALRNIKSKDLIEQISVDSNLLSSFRTPVIHQTYTIRESIRNQNINNQIFAPSKLPVSAKTPTEQEMTFARQNQYGSLTGAQKQLIPAKPTSSDILDQF
jgi:hypothetical protein